MAETAIHTDMFAAIDEAEGHDDLSLVVEPQPDRLPPMLFLAALIHGIVIIGITFNAALGEAASDAISLEVTIVADPGRSIAEPDDADYLAQASQEGSGNTREQVRPSSLDDSSVPIDNPGERDGTALVDTQALEQAADELLTSRREQDLTVAEDPRREHSQQDASAIALESGAEVTLPLPQENEVELEIYDDEPRQLLTSVDTRESVVAGYLHEWKRKIEIMGVRYFPEQALAQGITGSPTLEVTINASGELDEVVLRSSSGSSILDHAALDILRRAAPFDPFPEAIRVDYDQLRFAYKWQFSEVPTPSGGMP
jgi:periplasmic protein TonB